MTNKTKWMSAGNLVVGMLMVGQDGVLMEVRAMHKRPVNFHGGQAYSVDWSTATTSGTRQMAAGYRVQVVA